MRLPCYSDSRTGISARQSLKASDMAEIPVCGTILEPHPVEVMAAIDEYTEGS